MDPLIRTILEGDAAGFDALVEGGAATDTVTPAERWNLLHRALVSLAPGMVPSPAIVQRLIARGVPLDAADREGYTPLHFAARAGHAAIVRLLLDADAPVDAETVQGHTPLQLALARVPADAATVELLLERGARARTRLRRSP